MADSHCAKYAKFARRVQMGIEQAGPILRLRKKISTFQCVEKDAEGQGRGSAAKGKIMSFMAGQALAYLKIYGLGVAIMVLLWAAAKVWLIFYQKYLDPQGGDPED